MNTQVVVCILVFATSSVFAIFLKNKRLKIFLCIVSFIFALVIFVGLYQQVGVPLENNSVSVYLPFVEKKIYQVYWESKRENQFLFSVVRINKTTEDTLSEIFSRKSHVAGLFVVLDGEFHFIGDKEKEKILEKDLTKEEIKELLYLE